MQRLCAFLLLLLSATLSGCATAPREVASPAQQPAAPVAQPAPQAPRAAPAAPVATTHPYVSVPAVEAGGTAAPPRVSGTIALLLPLNSPVFGHAATAVKDGFMAGYGLSPAETTANAALRIKLYATGDQPDSILAAYRQALREGSQIVVGPLTRNGVTALATSGLVAVPTLALNIPDRTILPPHDLYFFGLSVEAEARQVAQIAYNSGKRRALIIATGTPLSRRSQQAFTEEWNELGGEVVGQYQASEDPDALSRLQDSVAASDADMIFLALGYNQARAVRSYLPLNAAIYATSRVDDAGSNPAGYFDLEGVQFVDMPWLLQPDHPAVMVYPRPDNLHAADFQRLYALGVDAYRLSRILLGSPGHDLTLDGVTGQIHLSGDNQLSRQLVHAEFRQGAALVVKAPAP
jgi:outer membrane PBP1 activator LpoA protein